MKETHKLLSKSKLFMLTYHNLGHCEYYEVRLTIPGIFSHIDILRDFDDYFSKFDDKEKNPYLEHNEPKRKWRILDKQTAESAITWAIIKWDSTDTMWGD